MKKPISYEDKDCTHIYHQYVVRAKNRDEFVEFLKENGVSTAVYYPVPVQMLQVYKYLGYKEGDLPVADETCKLTFALPMYPEIKREQQEYVASCMKKFLQK